jgi:hypothetical protein
VSRVAANAARREKDEALVAPVDPLADTFV